MDPDASKIRQAIEEDRAQVAETVQALAEKADVKGRLKGAVNDNAEHLQRTAADLGQRAQSGLETVRGNARQRPVPLAAGAAALVLFTVLLRWWGRRR